MLVFTAQSVIIPPAAISPTVRHALVILQRDMAKVFGRMPLLASSSEETAIVLRYAEDDDELAAREETFAIRFPHDHPGELHIVGSDDLGLMYGVLHVSREFLGVDPFWFWADLEPEKRVIEAANKVTHLIDRNLDSSQAIVQTTEALSSQAESLLQSVDRFKLK